MEQIRNRREETRKRLDSLKTQLQKAEEIADGKACVYATGSFGRQEASPHSDLDLFIVGRPEQETEPCGPRPSVLKQLDEVLLKSELISTTRNLSIPDFDGDGKYLVHYSADGLIRTLGRPEDDATNTFTARLLLFLESYPLIGHEVYREVIKSVIDEYWRDYGEHKQSFMPAFLSNDILRLWRTFCVNYEANTQREPAKKKAKRKLKNFKLKHSRLLTCYSALLYLLIVFRRNGSVAPEDATSMITLTPTERLEWILEQNDLARAHQSTEKLLERYERFLIETNFTEADMILRFMDPNDSRSLMEQAHAFGDAFFAVLNEIGEGSRFHRVLVV